MGSFAVQMVTRLWYHLRSIGSSQLHLGGIFYKYEYYLHYEEEQSGFYDHNEKNPYGDEALHWVRKRTQLATFTFN